MKSIAPNVHHRFLGAHAIGGRAPRQRNSAALVRALARVLPDLHLEINRDLGEGLAMEHHRVRPVGRYRNAAERRRRTSNTPST